MTSRTLGRNALVVVIGAGASYLVTLLLLGAADDSTRLAAFTVLFQVDAALLGLVWAASLIVGQVASRSNPRLFAAAFGRISWFYIALFGATLFFHFGVLSLPDSWQAACALGRCATPRQLAAVGIFLFCGAVFSLAPYGYRLHRELQPSVAYRRLRHRIAKIRDPSLMRHTLDDIEEAILAAHALGHRQSFLIGVRTLTGIAADSLSELDRRTPIPAFAGVPREQGRTTTSGHDLPEYQNASPALEQPWPDDLVPRAEHPVDEIADVIAARIDLIRQRLRSLAQSLILDPEAPGRIVLAYAHVAYLVLSGPEEGLYAQDRANQRIRKEAFNSLLLDVFWIAREALAVRGAPTVSRFAMQSFRKLLLDSETAAYNVAFRNTTAMLAQLSLEASRADNILLAEEGLRELTTIAEQTSVGYRRSYVTRRLRDCLRALGTEARTQAWQLPTLRRLMWLALAGPDPKLGMLLLPFARESLKAGSVPAEPGNLKMVIFLAGRLARHASLTDSMEVLQMLHDTVAPLVEEHGEEEAPDLKASLLAAMLTAALSAKLLDEAHSYIALTAEHYVACGADAPFWLVGPLYWLPVKPRTGQKPLLDLPLPTETATKVLGAIETCVQADIQHNRIREANYGVRGLKALAEGNADLAATVFHTLGKLLPLI